jgi:hypothetical protein
VEDGMEDTLAYMDFPYVHGAFPDGNSAMKLSYACLNHITRTAPGHEAYMPKKHLDITESPESDFLAGYQTIAKTNSFL